MKSTRVTAHFIGSYFCRLFLSLLLSQTLISCGGGGGVAGSGSSTFTRPDQGLGASVVTVAPARDGSGDIYVGGTFTSYNDTPANYIIRLNSDAGIERSFPVADGFDNEVTTIVAAADGSGDIYVGGWFTSYNGHASNFIIRLNGDGSIDNGFSVGTGFDSPVTTIVPAADGSGDIYVGGIFASYNGTVSNRIIRLDSTGSVDTTFAPGTGFDSGIKEMALVVDGSEDIYVGGHFANYDGIPANRIVRLNSNGSVDTAFVTGSGFDGVVSTIAPATDGSGDIYVGGEFASYKGTVSNRIVRLDSNGTLDADFVVGDGFDRSVHSLALSADGSGDLYVGGYFTAYKGAASHHIIRLNSDGSADSAFVPGAGIVGDVYALAPAGDGTGEIYVGGWFGGYNGTPSSGLVRLADSGSISQAYAANTAFDSDLSTIAPAADGSGDLYAGGWFNSYNATDANYILRLNSDGTADNSFSVGAGFDNSVNVITPLTDGSGDIYVGGAFTGYKGTTSNYIIRLNRDGSVDPGFAIGSGFDTAVNTIAPTVDGTGDIYVGGYFTSYNGSSSRYIVRLNSDGSLDSDFAVGTGFDLTVNRIVPAADGSGDIYVGGWFRNYNGTASNRIVRLNKDGSMDTGFITGSGFDMFVSTISPVTDGSGDIYVGGWFTGYNGTGVNRIVRLNSDGSVDAGFALGAGFNSVVYTIVPTDDGSGDIYVGGMFSDYNGTATNRFIRLNSDGTVDSGFAPGSGFIGSVATAAMAADGSGNVYVGGTFTTYRETTVMRIVLLSPDGGIN